MGTLHVMYGATLVETRVTCEHAIADLHKVEGKRRLIVTVPPCNRVSVEALLARCSHALIK